MARPRPYDQLGFAAKHVYPVLLLCLLPVISLTIFYAVQWRMNQSVGQLLTQRIAQDETIQPQHRAALLELVHAAPLSTILANTDPQWRPIQTRIHPETQQCFLSLRWGMYMSGACIALVFGAMGIIQLVALYAQRSPQAYLFGLNFGGLFIRLFFLAEFVLQVVLIIWLTFLFCMFFIEKAANIHGKAIVLIVLVMTLGTAAAAMFLAELFKNERQSKSIVGKETTPEESPGLWHLVTILSSRMQVPVPDHLVVGVTGSISATHAPLLLRSSCDNEPQNIKGRTIYVNLAVLRYLSSEQLTAAVAHELAHFRSDHTRHKLQIAEQTRQFQNFRDSLYQREYFRPIYCFSSMLWTGLQPAFAKHSQVLELGAAKASGEFTSPDIAAEAIVRADIYYDLHVQIENSYYTLDTPLERIEFRNTIDRLYPRSAQWYLLEYDETLEDHTHPYPSLSRRLAALDRTTEDSSLCRAMCHPLEDTAFRLVDNAADIERALWQTREIEFLEAHRQALVFRYLPETAQQWKLVEAYFPAGELILRDENTLSYDCEKMMFSQWEQPLYFHELYDMFLDRTPSNPTMTFYFRRNGKKKSTVLPISQILEHQDSLKHMISNYSDRLEAAVEYQKSKPLQGTSAMQMAEQSLFS
ncbi:M48 family metalloprotease [Bremerella alba]|uniref:Peptidase M48 domain-containing protein n=1 Tax=Bremerella alba TaxID=980252 RepID=A0A7V8V195_9BACT|nr:M48 family metalloprotease [Bremerella alba]MBA2112991.1 hypothetical protein [Bremerella alba]